jgi:hypothetical protein
MKHILNIQLSDDLYGSYAEHTPAIMTDFASDILQFCAYYKMSQPLYESSFIFIKEFLTWPKVPAIPSSSSWLSMAHV